MIISAFIKGAVHKNFILISNYSKICSKMVRGRSKVNANATEETIVI